MNGACLNEVITDIGRNFRAIAYEKGGENCVIGIFDVDVDLMFDRLAKREDKTNSVSWE